MSITMFDISRTAAIAAALRAGLRNVFPEVGPEPTTIAEIAEKVDADEHSVRLQLKALRAFGLVTFDGDSVTRARELTNDRSGVWATVLDYYSHFAARDFPRHLGGRMVGDYYQMLEEIAAPTATGLLHRYRNRTNLSVLDIGCGHAPHSRALLSHGVARSAVLVDDGRVLRETRQRVELEDLTDSVEFMPVTDLDRLGTRTFDLVLLLNVLYEMPHDKQQDLVQQCASWLRPGGEMVVQMFLRRSDEDWHADGLEIATAIRLGVRGDVLTRVQYEQMFEAAGLTIVHDQHAAIVDEAANVLLVVSRKERK